MASVLEHRHECKGCANEWECYERECWYPPSVYCQSCVDEGAEPTPMKAKARVYSGW